MKLSKTTISKTTYFLLAFLVAFSFSCNPEDGEDGMDGAVGATGQNGEDGNANVQTYTFDISALSGNRMDVNTPQLTQDVLENDAVLVYLTRIGSYYSVPGTSFGDEIKSSLFFSTVQLIFYNRLDGADIIVPEGRYELLKMVIIKSTSTTTGKTSSMQQVYNELNQASVNKNDYYAVCDYYGIDY